MSTKITQKPKITKKSNAKPKKIAGGRKGTEHVHGLTRQEKKTASGGGAHGSVQLPKGVEVREYPGERKGKNFGSGVQVVGHKG